MLSFLYNVPAISLPMFSECNQIIYMLVGSKRLATSFDLNVTNLWTVVLFYFIRIGMIHMQFVMSV